MAITRQPDRPPEKLAIACECGSVHLFVMGHYDIGRGHCGKSFWALRPHRAGPLQLFPWPGLPIRSKELKNENENHS